MRPAMLALSLIVFAGCSSKPDPVEKKYAEQQIQFYADLNADLAKADKPGDVAAAVRKFEEGRRKSHGDSMPLNLDPKKVQEYVAKLDKKMEQNEQEFNAILVKLHAKYTDSPDNPRVVFETVAGPITVELFEKVAPITVKNFLDYVDAKHYDGTIFHRVMPEFMIQGGGFTPDMKELPTKKGIANESDNLLPNRRGYLAMARTNVPDSASAQFFINVVDNPPLDRLNAQDGVGYAVFGKVVDGMDAVDKIRAVKTGEKDGHQNVPTESVVIKSAKRVEKK